MKQSQCAVRYWLLTFTITSSTSPGLLQLFYLFMSQICQENYMKDTHVNECAGSVFISRNVCEFVNFGNTLNMTQLRSLYLTELL